MANPNNLIRFARLFHLYSGVFLAPALVFFAFTGAVQTVSLHETTRGSDYKPPAILVELAQLHKKQTLEVPGRKEPPPASKPAQGEPKTDGAAAPQGAGSKPGEGRTPSPAAPGPELRKSRNPWPMKLFFLVASAGLFFSTLTGLYMSYKFARSKRRITATLVAGVVIPLLLLLF